jgi:hypothetical protein
MILRVAMLRKMRNYVIAELNLSPEILISS